MPQRPSGQAGPRPDSSPAHAVTSRRYLSSSPDLDPAPASASATVKRATHLGPAQPRVQGGGMALPAPDTAGGRPATHHLPPLPAPAAALTQLAAAAPAPAPPPGPTIPASKGGGCASPPRPRLLPPPAGGGAAPPRVVPPAPLTATGPPPRPRLALCYTLRVGPALVCSSLPFFARRSGAVFSGCVGPARP